MVESKKTTWSKAMATFFAPIFLALFVRWALFEPYVIPSGSMIPTLLIHDHILVNKWAFGFRLPFTERWLGFWKKPQPGDVVVFRYPKSPDTFFIKRVVGIEGDVVSVRQGQLVRNGHPVERIRIEKIQGFDDTQRTLDPSNSSFIYYSEILSSHHFVSRSITESVGASSSDTLSTMADTSKSPLELEFRVPPGHFFVVGDNRDESSDSRVWGTVPNTALIGTASLIWLSCEKTLPSAPFLCDPNSIRWNRMFKGIE